MHFSDILIRVKVAIGSEDSEREVLVRDSSHKILNKSQLALFSFHLGL